MKSCMDCEYVSQCATHITIQFAAPDHIRERKNPRTERIRQQSIHRLDRTVLHGMVAVIWRFVPFSVEINVNRGRIFPFHLIFVTWWMRKMHEAAAGHWIHVQPMPRCIILYCLRLLNENCRFARNLWHQNHKNHNYDRLGMRKYP